MVGSEEGGREGGKGVGCLLPASWACLQDPPSRNARVLRSIHLGMNPGDTVDNLAKEGVRAAKEGVLLRASLPHLARWALGGRF